MCLIKHFFINPDILTTNPLYSILYNENFVCQDKFIANFDFLLQNNKIYDIISSEVILMANKNISKKLRQARVDAGLSQNDVYNWLGVSQCTFSSWETGKSEPSILVFLNLCLKYEIDNISEYFLDDEAVSSNSVLDARMLKKLSELPLRSRAAVYNCLDFEYSNMRIQQYSKRRPIPVYMQPAAAGLGNYLGDCKFDEMELDAPEEADAGIRISGDSMEPIIHDDEIVLVKFCPRVEGNQVGIFVLNGEAYCKRLEYRLGEAYLCSFNSKYSPIHIKASDNLRVIGRVLI